MDKNYLLKTAKELKQVDTKTAEEYRKKSDELISQINKKMLEKTEINNLIGGEHNLSMMQDNHGNHVRFIASILKNYNPDVFVETVLWVFRAYRSHGFTTNYWAAQMNTWVEILKEVFSPDIFNAIYPFYEWMQTNIPIFVKVSNEDIETPNAMH
ncbi:MAG: hypothetical protein R6U04_11405 [Bacteroidales bacterium]